MCSTIFEDRLLIGFKRCKVVAASKMDKMDTKQLMALRKKMLSIEARAHEHDDDGKQFWPDKVLTAIQQCDDIFFKEDVRWMPQYKALKKILGSRENIPNKKERRRKRQQVT